VTEVERGTKIWCRIVNIASAGWAAVRRGAKPKGTPRASFEGTAVGFHEKMGQGHKPVEALKTL